MATSKSTTAKTSAAKAPRSTPAPTIKAAEVVVPKVSVVEAPPGVTAAVAPTVAPTSGQQAMLKKQELVERILKASGAKKKDVKLIVDATLGVLGDALSAGEELNLPPVGKRKVNRQRDEGNVEVLILKLRRGGGKAGGGNATPKDALDGDEDDN